MLLTSFEILGKLFKIQCLRVFFFLCVLFCFVLLDEETIEPLLH